MTVKNYKEMCRLLGESETTGNSKKSQLKRWECYFHWVKKGHKFEIKEIYDEPLELQDGRIFSREKYVRKIEWLLAWHLSNCDGYTFTLTRKKWWNLLGMVNERYLDKKYSIDMFDGKYIENEVQWFFNRSTVVLNDILRNALKSMCDRALIDYEIQTVIVRNKKDGEWFQAGDEELSYL